MKKNVARIKQRKYPAIKDMFMNILIYIFVSWAIFIFFSFHVAYNMTSMVCNFSNIFYVKPPIFLKA